MSLCTHFSHPVAIAAQWSRIDQRFPSATYPPSHISGMALFYELCTGRPRSREAVSSVFFECCETDLLFVLDILRFVQVRLQNTID